MHQPQKYPAHAFSAQIFHCHLENPENVFFLPQKKVCTGARQAGNKSGPYYLYLLINITNTYSSMMAEWNSLLVLPDSDDCRGGTRNV